MGTFTPILNLFKPNNQDQVNVKTDLADNFDKIDAHANSATAHPQIDTRLIGTYAPGVTLMSVAVGDGVADDTAAIRTAMAAAVAAGRMLLSDKRTYKITGSIDLPTGLDADFGNATFFVADGTDKNVTALRAMGTNNITVRNLTLRCNRANRTPGTEAGSVSGEFISGNGVTTRTTNDVNKTYAADILFENVRVFDSPNHAWEIVGAERVRIINCYAQGAGDDGFSVGGKNATDVDLQPARMVTIANCIARGSVGNYSTNSNGFEVDDGAYDVTITGCLAENNFTGGYQAHGHDAGVSPYNVTFSGNVSRNNPTHGFRVETQAGTPDQPRNITISGNVVEGPSTWGIYLRRTDSAIAIGNACEGLPIFCGDADGLAVIGNKAASIAVEAGAASTTDALIADNILKGAAARGIYVAGTGGFTLTRVAIRNNIILTTVSEGIYLNAAIVDGSVIGNVISGHTLMGIRVKSVTGVLVSGNTVTGVDGTVGANTESIMVDTCTKAVVADNVVSGGTTGIRMSTSPDTAVTGNRVSNPGGAGIYLVASGGCPVVGNRISGGARGIDSATSGTDAVLSGNVISGTSSFAIRQQAGVDYWLIIGNNYRGLTAPSLAGANNTVASNVA